jgi:hypothetical protein
MLKVHESQLFYFAFVAQQIIKIVGSQIEVERVFNIANICINMRRSKLGIENLEMLVSVYKVS